MTIENKTTDLIQQLFEKYRLSGQDTNDYLEGLLVSNYEPYWKYLHIDTLLSLQNPKTDFHDEFIFIGYHQITELYFRLILHEIDHIQQNPADAALVIESVKRMNRYFRNLINSFEIMTDGMRPQEFLKFRMALLPASGFQSYQFRLIELALTSLDNLKGKIQNGDSNTLESAFQNIYWKQGAIDLKTGEKTLTLKQFEKQYDSLLTQKAKYFESLNLNNLYSKLQMTEEQRDVLQVEMRHLDIHVNVNWRLAHYRSAVRYLQRPGKDVPATGGTNWQEFLPPRFQRIISFPELWSNEEIANWGKSWVDENIV